MLLGYARVSKADDQDTAAQVSALKAAGCTRVYEEKASGGRWDRPQLHRMLDQLREGDVIVVWKLDRLSRSLKDLLHILEKIDAAAANFRSLTEAIDTSGPAGRMMMQMLGSFAEFERAMVRERTRAGLKAAREQGRKGGRRSKLMPRQRAEILAMLADGRAGAEIARIFRVHRATISRIAAEARTVSPKTGAAPEAVAMEAAAEPLLSESSTLSPHQWVATGFKRKLLKQRDFQIGTFGTKVTTRPIMDRGPSLFHDFELDRSPCLFLDHGATVAHPAASAYVVDLQADEIATSELAIDREVEQSKISFPALQLKPNPNGPDIFRLERALLADQAALVPGSPLARNR